MPNYGEPFYWWGPTWAEPPRLGIGDLLRNGTLDSRSGAVLWAAMERRWSAAIIGGPSGLGKSTLLAAMLDFLPEPTKRIYIRGSYETFSFLRDRAVDPGNTILLANELSPHLPIYAWGSMVSRLLDLGAGGYQIAATAHATSPMEFVALLARGPLRIAPSRIAQFRVVIQLDFGEQPESGRSVRGIWQMRPATHGIEFEPLYTEPLHDISQEPLVTNSPHTFPFQSGELSERGVLLEQLRLGTFERLPAWRQ